VGLYIFSIGGTTLGLVALFDAYFFFFLHCAEAVWFRVFFVVCFANCQ